MASRITMTVGADDRPVARERVKSTLASRALFRRRRSCGERVGLVALWPGSGPRQCVDTRHHNLFLPNFT